MPDATIDLPPEADVLVNRVRKVEGTLGGSGYVKYGGEEFKPGKDFPEWEGVDLGGGKKTHAAGPGQWQPGTWKEQKDKFKGYGLDLDFSNETHQKAAIWDKGYEEYKKSTGRDLREDIKANKVEWSALAPTWQGFQPRVTRTDKPGGKIDDKAIAYEQSRPHQSVWYVDPKEMLGLLPEAEPEESAQKRKSLSESLFGRGEDIYDLPHIEVSKGEKPKITDWDGRHRLQAMIDAGLTAVPVVIKGVEPGARPLAIEGMTGKVMPMKFDPVPKISLAQAYLKPDPGSFDPSQAAKRLLYGPSGQPMAPPPPNAGPPQLPRTFAELYDRPGQPQFVPAEARQPEAAGQTTPASPPIPQTNALRSLTPEGQSTVAAADEARAMPLIQRGPPPLERITPERATLAQEALQRGIPVTGPENAASQVAKERALAQNVSRTFGEDAPALTSEVLARAQKRIGDGLNRIERRHQVPFDNQFRSDMIAISNEAESQLTTPGQIRVVEKHLKDIMVDPVKTEAAKKVAQSAPKTPGKPASKPKEVLRGGLSGEQFGNLIHEKGPIAKLSNNPDPGIAMFGDKIGEALRDLLQRRLPADEAAEYQGLRYQYKNLKTAEKAVGSVGQVDPGKLDTAVNRSFPNRKRDKAPDLVKLSDIANEFVKPRAPRELGAAKTVAVDLAGAGLGHLVGGPIGGLVGAFAMHQFGRNALRSMLQPRLTDGLINRALQELPPPGARRNAINALMSRAGAMSLAVPQTNALSNLGPVPFRLPAGRGVQPNQQGAGN